MSTLAELTPNLDEFKSAIYNLLQPDVTLQGTTYLNGLYQVVAQEKAPDKLAPPRLHILFFDPLVDAYTVSVDVPGSLRAFVANHDQGVVADRGRLGRILQRGGQLLTGHGTFTAAGYRFMDCYVEGFTDVQIDPASPEESYQDLLFRFRGRKL